MRVSPSKPTPTTSPCLHLWAPSQTLRLTSRLCLQGLPPRIADSIVRTLALIRERIDEEIATRFLPPVQASANDCLLFYAESEQGRIAADKLQKTLSTSAAQKLSMSLLESASPTQAARFFACTAPYASSWLSDPFLAQPMRDEAHGAACKLRLNQPISNIATCYCGDSLELDPWHVLSHKGGGEAGRRHDEIVNRLVDAVQRAGLPSIWELIQNRAHSCLARCMTYICRYQSKLPSLKMCSHFER